MPTLENSAALPQKARKKKGTQSADGNLSSNGLLQPSGGNAKKRSRQSDKAEEERPRKKRSKHHGEQSSHSNDDSSAAFSTSATESKGSTKKKRSKEKGISDAPSGSNRIGGMSNGIVMVSPAPQDVQQHSSHDSGSKKRKRRRKEGSQTIMPVNPQSEPDNSALPIDPVLLQEYGYDPNTNALPFSDAAIDFSTFGMGTNSTSDDIIRAINSMDLSSLSKATGHQFIEEPSPSNVQGSVQRTERKNKPRSEALGALVYDPNNPQGLLRKWITTKHLKELADKHGFEYSKGAFTAAERDTVQMALDSFAMRHNISGVDVVELMFMKKSRLQPEYKNFWTEIAESLPKRPLPSIFNFCRRAYHPLQKQGKWTEEEDEAIIAAVTEFGQMWEKVSGRVGRTAMDCRDRYRNQILSANRVRGAWSKEEEAQLVEIMAEFNYEKPKGEDNDIFWRNISHRMGGSRSIAQIRTKWQDSLGKTFKPDGQRRWSPVDSYILIHKIATMNVSDESEIDWKLLGDEGWNLWSAHTIQKHWFSMKKRVEGYETMPFYELLDILIAKKGSLSQKEIEDAIKKAQEARPPRAHKEYGSKAFIEDSDEALGEGSQF